MPKGAEPRRLSRASRQPPSVSHTTSAPSSNSSMRAERSTRSHNKTASPQKSSTPQSLTSEEAADQARAATSEPPQLRRSKRTHDNDDDGDMKPPVDGDDEIIEDEETTRCLCGQLEYPGPPDAGKSAKSHGANAEELSDDRGGLFIQCDKCEVWQHGGCVSIMEEESVPDNYYCEECKPELHELHKTSNGQKYSCYLPVWSKTHPKSARKGSVDKDDKSKLQKEKERALRTLPESKRRSTMNSRAAEVDDETLQAVLEMSKAEGQGSTVDGSRKGKRFRDDSEDVHSGIKRQRTTSSVVSSRSGMDDSGDESDSVALKKLPRNAKSHKEKEAPSKQRAEASANSRKGRAERRRGDGEQASSLSATSQAGPKKDWTCHCGLWTCLCRPSPNPPSANGFSEHGDHNGSSSGEKLNDSADEEHPVEESKGDHSTRPSAKASPVEASEPPDTPQLGATTTSKRGGKRPGAGRGRSNPAPTPAGDDKPTPRDEADTPIPSVTINGASAAAPVKRSKRGQRNAEHESGDSDKDNSHNNSNGVPGSDAEATNGNSGGNGTNGHTTGTKKKEPSMAELKRRAAYMVEWIERAKEDYARNAAIGISLEMDTAGLPNGLAGGAVASPPSAGPVLSAGTSPTPNGLSGEAEGLHSKLLSWQVEFAS